MFIVQRFLPGFSPTLYDFCEAHSLRYPDVFHVCMCIWKTSYDFPESYSDFTLNLASTLTDAQWGELVALIISSQGGWLSDTLIRAARHMYGKVHANASR